jgi:Arc/MetJ-type ribon-helix-helix transcriptional regulator
MSPKDKILTFRPDDEVYAAMEALRERDGVPFSEQIRRALRAWLQEKGLAEKAANRRAATRRKA